MLLKQPLQACRFECFATHHPEGGQAAGIHTACSTNCADAQLVMMCVLLHNSFCLPSKKNHRKRSPSTAQGVAIQEFFRGQSGPCPKNFLLAPTNLFLLVISIYKACRMDSPSIGFACVCAWMRFSKLCERVELPG